MLSVAYFLRRVSGIRDRLGEVEGRLSRLSRTRDRLGEAEGRLSRLSRTRDRLGEASGTLSQSEAKSRPVCCRRRAIWIYLACGMVY